MDANRTGELNEEPRFGLLAVCKDRLTGVCAKLLNDRLSKEIEDECGFSFDLPRSAANRVRIAFCAHAAFWPKLRRTDLSR
jgi:hypothetical protein